MWKTEWNALSARIEGLVEATKFLLLTIHTGEHDNYGMTDELLKTARDIIYDVNKFCGNFESQIPAEAMRCLASLVQPYEQRLKGAHGLPGIQGVITLLASFRSEFNYLLNDIDVIGRSLVSRSFAHLQRSIIADPEFAKRWQTGFDHGETACEKLGAAHLLLHGIWAFKASAEGERTDLVLGSKLSVDDSVRRSAEALVLTEWKMVREPKDVNSQAGQGLKQALRYSSGILAGFELSARRYVVLVSKQFVAVPTSTQEKDISYEYVNIAVSPSVPSSPMVP
jgi:hypothetical protein